MTDIPLSLTLLIAVGVLAASHASWSVYTSRISQHSYWFRATPALALTTPATLYMIVSDPAATHPVTYTVAALAALLCAYGTRQAYLTRTLPPAPTSPTSKSPEREQP